MKKTIFIALTVLIIGCSTSDEPKIQFTLSIEISPIESGMTNPISGNYDEGSLISLIATPSEGFKFKNWSGSITENINPIQLLLDSNKSIIANFEEVRKTYIPDDNFEQTLIDLGYDNKLDDYVITDNINKILNINLSDKGIQNLIGIQDFENLEILDISNNPQYLTEENDNKIIGLDISKNLKLKSLICYNNLITNLNLEKNTKLENLNCASNKLNILYVLKNVELKELNFINNNINSIDISSLSKLTKLKFDNNNIESIDLTNINLLNTLWCYGNKLTTLDISNNLDLYVLQSKQNQINCIKVNQNQLSNIPIEWEKDDFSTYSINCN